MSFMQLVVFKLDGQEYGVDIKDVREIGPLGKIVKLPNTPDYLEGILDLREQIIPVVNLKKRLKTIKSDICEDSRVLITLSSNRLMGYVVDEAQEVISVDIESIEKNFDLNANVHSRYVKGVAKIEERIIVLLSLSAIIKEEQHENVNEVNM
ncbi:MAG: chemotaxis protein CheW [Bacillota bacterium]